jgi:cell division protein FtsL
MTAHVAGSSRQAKQEKRRTWIRLTEAQAALSWAVVLALLAVLGAIYLVQTSRIAGVGRHVQQLQAQVDDLKRTNDGMVREIAEAQSLERLQADAARLGFRRATADAVEYLVVPDYPVGPPPEPAAPAAEPAAPAESFGEALFLAIGSSVSDFIRGESP